MGRQEREDSKPIFYLEDQSEALDAASKAVGKRVSRLYFGERDPLHFIQTSYIAKHRWQLIRQQRMNEASQRSRGKKPLKLDVGLMAFMMDHCARADHREIEKKDGMIKCKFVTVGCRLYAKQDQIAEMYKIVNPDSTRETINKQIRLMYNVGIIVNKAHGWVEFDAELCWNGRIDLWLAYRKVQETYYGSTVVMLNGEEINYKNFRRPLDYNEAEIKHIEDQIEEHEASWSKTLHKEHKERGLEHPDYVDVWRVDP